MITHVMPPNVPPFALVREVSHGVALRPPRDEGRRCCCPYDIRQKHPCNAPPKSIPLHLCSTTRNDRLEIKAEVVVVPMTFVKSTHAMPRKVRPFTFVFYNPERPPGDEGRRSCCSQDESRKESQPDGSGVMRIVKSTRVNPPPRQNSSETRHMFVFLWVFGRMHGL